MGQPHTVHRVIDLSCVEGVAVELRHVLPGDWRLTEEADSFVVRGVMGDDWQDQLWRMVRFVAYVPFFSLEQTHQADDEVRYQMVSASRSGGGFRIELILVRP